ncbi:uncharacterized protein LOC124131899 [Haliotis rufescens]|uniref:uncharacterized protein LOC124131899 n=1 Tax=Haliotis rufescens TaxID=6454 RepID=UPI001EAFE6CE|nr:uncharacterized protein LOC124131899 [Haliotis rufescens]XP_046351375.1 uncharacterized protein LOC124131899 [Haliotis rufescens]
MSAATGSHSSGKKRKVVHVVLLNGEEYLVTVDVKSKFQEVFNQVASHLSLRETEYFGLAFKKDDEFNFLVLEEKIHKQAGKRWKTAPGEGYDSHGKPMLTVWFRVQFYVDQVVLLREKVTRHLYFLQLKENFLKYVHLFSEEKCFELVGYALQADYGNYIPDKHQDGYFDPRKYFPAWIVEKLGIAYLTKHAPSIHKDIRHTTKSDAELRFIRETSIAPAAHNVHFYKAKKKKTDKVWNTWLAVCAKGVEVYEELEGGFKNWISTFLWPDIGKLYFDKKKFEIRTTGGNESTSRKFTYYTEVDGKSKYLLSICRTTHMFQLAIQPKLMEIRHLDAEDQRRYRESYIYSDPRDMVTNGGIVQYRASMSPKKSGGNQRYSVISDASSATTSGIVSDKMTISFDDSDDHGKEIMIDCPPRTIHGTPGQGRSKFGQLTAGGFPSYKQTGMSSVNRSPVLPPHSLELYKPPASRTSSGHSPTGGSMALPELSPVSSNGSYRAKLQQQQQVLFPTRVPGYPRHLSSSSAEDKTSQPVSRSTSLGDSFKAMQTQLQVHTDNVSPSEEGKMCVSAEHSCQNSHELKISPLESSAYANIQASLNNSQYAPPPAPFPQAPVNPPILTDKTPSPSSSAGLTTLMMTECPDLELREAREEYVPPQSFVEGGAVSELPVDSLQSMKVLGDTVSSSVVAGPGYSTVTTGTAEAVVVSAEAAGGEAATGGQDSGDEDPTKPKNNIQISVKNHRETLHPELAEICHQSHALSLPLITALCNDQTLMHTNSGSGSCGSYDTSTLRSTDSRHSRISHETDSRRWSTSYPSTASTMISVPTGGRPYSWHSEHFDLDTQLSLTHGPAFQHQPLLDNHRSVPQDLCSPSNPTSSWTHAIAYNMPYAGSLDRYSPELIAQNHMIPPRLSSGGHSKTDGNLSHKALKENIGIA